MFADALVRKGVPGVITVRAAHIENGENGSTVVGSSTVFGTARITLKLHASRSTLARVEMKRLLELAKSSDDIAHKVPQLASSVEHKLGHLTRLYKTEAKGFLSRRKDESLSVRLEIKLAKKAKRKAGKAGMVAKYKRDQLKEARNEYNKAKFALLSTEAREMGSREDYDASVSYVRTAKWMAGINKGEAKNRLEEATSKVNMAKLRLSTAVRLYTRQTKQYKDLDNDAQKANTAWNNAVANEENADRMREFQAKVVADQKKREAAEGADRVAAAKRKAADAGRLAAAAAAALKDKKMDPKKVEALAAAAAQGSKLATRKAAEQSKAMEAQSQERVTKADAAAKAFKKFEATTVNEAGIVIKIEDKSRKQAYIERMKYYDMREKLESAMLHKERMLLQMAGAQWIQNHTAHLKAKFGGWIGITQREKSVAIREAKQAKGVAFRWGFEVQKWRKLTRLAEGDEATFRKDQVSTVTAKRQLDAVIVTTETARRTMWRHVFHLQSVAGQMKKKKEALLGYALAKEQQAATLQKLDKASVGEDVALVTKARQDVANAQAAQANHAMMAAEQARDIKADKKAGVNAADVATDKMRKAQEKSDENTDRAKQRLREAGVSIANSKVQAGQNASDRNKFLAAELIRDAKSLRAAAAQMGNFKAMLQAVWKKGAHVNTFNAKLEKRKPILNQLRVEADREHSIKKKDMAEKQNELRRVSGELSAAMRFVSQRKSYLSRAESLRIEILERRDYVDKLIRMAAKTYKHAAGHKKLAEADAARIVEEMSVQKPIMLAAAKTAMDMVDGNLVIIMKATKPPATPYVKEPAALMAIHTKYRNMQKLWKIRTLGDCKARRDKMTADRALAEAEMRRAKMGLKLEKKTLKFTQAEQMTIVQTSLEQQKEASNYMGEMKKLPIEKRTVLLEKEEAFTNMRNFSAVEQQKVDALNVIRYAATTKALTARYYDQYGRAQKKITPNTRERMAESTFDRITAAWDRDGTPQGPGYLENAVSGNLIYTHRGRTGFLHKAVIGACGEACILSRPKCSRGKVGRACTKGRVFRVRYQSATLPGAFDNYFMCQCNSGVTQYTSRERTTWNRGKNSMVTAAMDATGISFKKRLARKESVPPAEIACFSGFMAWMNGKYGKNYVQLDRMVNAPKQANEQYAEARRLWYYECVKRKDTGKPTGFAEPKVAWITDSSMDVRYHKAPGFQARERAKARKHQARAENARRQKAAIQASEKRGKAATRKEAAKLASIRVGDKTQRKLKAKAKKKDGSAGRPPSIERQGLKEALKKRESAKKTLRLELAANKQADKQVAGEATPKPKLSPPEERELRESEKGASKQTSAATDGCWSPEPGTTFVYRATECGTEGARAGAKLAKVQWGTFIAGARRPETEGAKLMSVVAPYGCKKKAKMGGALDTYWGRATGASNITLPCDPSGETTFLTPQGRAKKAAIDLIREAERKEASDYKKAFLKAQAIETLKAQAKGGGRL